MSTPCEQESTIKAISQALIRMERAQEYVITLLQDVANQKARIESLEEHKDTCLRNADELFARLRKIELTCAAQVPPHSITPKIDSLSKKLDKLNRFFQITTHKYALIGYFVILGMIVLGTALDVMYHWDKISSIWHFVKGY